MKIKWNFHIYKSHNTLLFCYEQFPLTVFFSEENVSFFCFLKFPISSHIYHCEHPSYVCIEPYFYLTQFSLMPSFKCDVGLLIMNSLSFCIIVSLLLLLLFLLNFFIFHLLLLFLCPLPFLLPLFSSTYSSSSFFL